jgi:Holliday junction resolvase RusA-like endonuclease
MKFTVLGKPQGKARPRHTKQGHTYTPQKTREYEELIAYEFIKQCKPNKDYTGAIKMRVCAYYEPAKSISKRKREELLYKPYLFKSDLDNTIKVICDALNKIAYKDDSQIYSIECKKIYDEKSRIEVEIIYE